MDGFTRIAGWQHHGHTAKYIEVCDECGAVVEPQTQLKHLIWHEDLRISINLGRGEK